MNRCDMGKQSPRVEWYQPRASLERELESKPNDNILREVVNSSKIAVDERVPATKEDTQSADSNANEFNEEIDSIQPDPSKGANFNNSGLTSFSFSMTVPSIITP